MTGSHVMDTSALMSISECCDKNQFTDLLAKLSELVDDGVLMFPKAVVKELEIYGRAEPVMYWAIGLGKKLRRFSTDVEHKLAVMQVIQYDLGYDGGLEDMDGSDPAIIELAALGHMLQSINIEFWMVSEDRGSAPLRPTMEEICAHYGWVMLSTSDGLKGLGLDQYLSQ